MQRPAVTICIALILLAGCSQDDTAGDATSAVAEAVSEDGREFEEPGVLTLTEEGEERAARDQAVLPQIDPREDAFARSLPMGSILYPHDYRIGPVGPPVNAFDRQLWQIAHELLAEPNNADVTVSTFDSERVKDLSATSDENSGFRVSPPLKVGDGEYSLLFRRTGEESVKGELVLALQQGGWYTAGIQWELVSDHSAPFAPGQSTPQLVW